MTPSNRHPFDLTPQDDAPPPIPASERPSDITKLTWPTAVVVAAFSIVLGFGITWGGTKAALAAATEGVVAVREEVKSKADKLVVDRVEERQRATDQTLAAVSQALSDLRDSSKRQEIKIDRLLERKQ